MLNISLIDDKRIPWIIRLLYDFPYAMDLTDDTGAPDHDKMLPAFAAIAFVVFIFMHPTPSWQAMVAWIVAGGYIYGFSAWRLVANRTLERLIKNGKHSEPNTTLEAASPPAGQGE